MVKINYKLQIIKNYLYKEDRMKNNISLGEVVFLFIVCFIWVSLYFRWPRKIGALLRLYFENDKFKKELKKKK